jgi:hypothetical protein
MALFVLNQPATKFFSEAKQIDDRAGIIYGMSVISCGEAKGHGLRIDAKTLETCLAATKSWKDGVICKGDHGSGIFQALGTLKNFRIDGDKLRGDLHLFNNQPLSKMVLEVARKSPAALGLSISFSYAPEVVDEEVYVRVKSLSSIDLVDNPAANPNGMFSGGPRNKIMELTAAFIASEGQDGARRIQNAPEGQRVDLMERALYFHGCTIPGYSFAHLNAKFGEPPPVRGLRRIETASKQQRISAALTRLA